LDRLAGSHRLLRPGDPGYASYTGDVVLEGHPDAVVRPEGEEEIREILAAASADGIPVTAAGGQTSLTGSSVAEEGILLATERMDRFVDLAPDAITGRMTATAEPGIFLGDFQRLLEAQGWFYPPDPTSRNEARLGATVATNATGEDSLLYGPTRRWVRALRVVTAGGDVRELRRSPASHPAEEKATAGYYQGGETIDLLVGSEGTLGVLSRITVDVIPLPDRVVSGLAFFPSLRGSLEFVAGARDHPVLTPRALELIDGGSLELVASNPEGFRWPEGTRGAVVFKQEAKDEADRDRLLDEWLSFLGECLAVADGERYLDAAIVVESHADQERLRAFRHRVPAEINERVRRTRDAGGGKLGTDWWIPYRRLPVFLEAWMERIRGAGLEAVVFGHAGNGHPHVNFLLENARERSLAEAFHLEMCREAVSLGGGVAGEHGLGKKQRHLLGIQYPPQRIDAMRAVKREWDPGWILGRGNLFEETT